MILEVEGRSRTPDGELGIGNGERRTPKIQIETKTRDETRIRKKTGRQAKNAPVGERVRVLPGACCQDAGGATGLNPFIRSPSGSPSPGISWPVGPVLRKFLRFQPVRSRCHPTRD